VAGYDYSSETEPISSDIMRSAIPFEEPRDVGDCFLLSVTNLSNGIDVRLANGLSDFITS
jgi:hypothetical protein